MIGMSIKNAEDWVRLYKEDPDLALGLIFENIADIKEKMHKNRFKNAGLHAVSGLAGGIAAAITYIKFLKG